MDKEEFKLEEINVFALEEECIKYPAFYDEYSEKLSDIRREILRIKKDHADEKSAFERKRAKIEIEIRSHPEKWGFQNPMLPETKLLPKATESTYEAIINVGIDEAINEKAEDVDDDFKELAALYQSIQDLKSKEDDFRDKEEDLKRIVNSLEERKFGIEQLIQLYIHKYFSVPKTKKVEYTGEDFSKSKMKRMVRQSGEGG